MSSSLILFEGKLHLPLLFLVVALFLALALPLYRAFFGPLSNIPGPKLAAFTPWYQTYYDIYLGGKFTLHVEEIHKKYGT